MGLFSDINEVVLLGNVTQDPEVRYTKSGTPVVGLGMATNRSYKQEDEWKTETEFHNLVFWGKFAEQAGERLKKGSKVLIKGRLQTQSWEADGIKKYKTEIVVSDLTLIDRYNTKDGNTITKNTPKGENTPKDNFEDFEDFSEGSEGETIDPDDLPF